MLDNKALGEYLKSIREAKHLSLRQVDYKSSISYSHLSMIENGTRKPTALTLKELAGVYDVDYIDLYEKAGYIDLAEAEKVKNKTDLLGNPVVSIPILGVVKAGYDYLAQENWIGTLDINRDIVKDGKDYFALYVHGDSMLPDFKEGDIVLVKKQNDFENGQVVIALVNGDEATIKKAYKSNDGLLLQPINNSYQPLIFSKEDIKKIPVRIAGIVVQLQRKI